MHKPSKRKLSAKATNPDYCQSDPTPEKLEEGKKLYWYMRTKKRCGITKACVQVCEKCQQPCANPICITGKCPHQTSMSLYATAKALNVGIMRADRAIQKYQQSIGQLLIPESTLKRLYLIESRSILYIANQYMTSEKTIRDAFKRYGIKPRNRGNPYKKKRL